MEQQVSRGLERQLFRMAGQESCKTEEGNRRPDEQYRIESHDQDFVSRHGYSIPIRFAELRRLTSDSTDSRSRRGSESPAIAGLNPPRRTETYASLPPYSPPQRNWEQEEDVQPRAKTPADILGMKVEYEGEKSDTKLKSEKSRALLESDDIGPSKIFASPQSSPNSLRPIRSSSDLDKAGTLRPLESRRNTETEVASPPDALGIFNNYSTSPSLSRIFTSPSGLSIAPSRQPSLGEPTSPILRQDSFFSLDSALLEVTMSNLSGVKMCVR